MLTGRLGANPIITYSNVFQSGADVFVPSRHRAARCGCCESTATWAAAPSPSPPTDWPRGGALHCAINVLPAREKTSAIGR